MRHNVFSLYGRSRHSFGTASNLHCWSRQSEVSSIIRTEARRAYSRQRPGPIHKVRLSLARKQVNRIFLAVFTIGLGGSAYLLRDDLKHWWIAAVRSGRVVRTLYVNIQE